MEQLPMQWRKLQRLPLARSPLYPPPLNHAYRAECRHHDRGGDVVIQALLEVGTTSEYVGVETKKCTQCGEVKARTEFSKRARSKDGLNYYCKSCNCAYCKAYCVAHSESIKDRKAAYYAANAERIKASIRLYNANHKEERAAYLAEYRAKNPTLRWARSSIHKHRKKFTVVATLDELLEMAKAATHCPKCDVEFDWLGKSNQDNLPSWDRKFNGKRMTKDNTQIICLRCNMAKGNMPMPEFEEHCIKIALKSGKVVRV